MEAVAEMRGLIAGGFGMEPVADIAAILARCSRGLMLAGVELLQAGRAIAAADLNLHQLRSEHTPRLRQYADGVRSQRALARELSAAFGPGGELLDGASAELARIRREAASALEAARRRATALTNNAAISRALQEQLVTQRDDRFVIPVKAEFAAAVPGIIHDASASGQTVFIEPAAVFEANNRVRTLRLQEQHEIERILRALTMRLAREIATVEHLFSAAVEIDGIYGRARLAAEMQATIPVLAAGTVLDVREGRHPLLGPAAIPQTFALDEQRRLLMISGPNMGGKTVTLKLAALLILMAACGMHVPAGEGSVIGAFTNLVADIGDAQSLAANTSTFAAHVRRLREMLELARPGMLYVVDEIAGGTESNAGSALAVAVLDGLARGGALGIVTTHAQELKAFAQERPWAINAGMRFDPQTHAPLFMLDVGLPGRSLALDLAAREGLPADILAAARELLGGREREYDHALAELSQARADLAAERAALRREAAEQRTATLAVAAERQSFDAEREAFFQQGRRELEERLAEFDAELRRRAPADLRRTGRSQIVLLGRMREKLQAALVSPAAVEPGAEPALELRPGLTVRIEGFEQPATVVAVAGDDVTVTLGAMRMNVSAKRIAPVAAADRKAVKREVRRRLQSDGEAHIERLARAAFELDVRGRRFVEAEPLVERWIDDAIAAGVRDLRLIHGKGTGALGQGLQEYLGAHPQVVDLRYGNENEGGGGVTIIALR